MKLEAKNNCPLNKFEPCKQLECAWFTKVAGTHPQTGKEIEEWGCAMTWLPILMIENSQAARQTGAAVESFRNVMVQMQSNPVAISKLQAEAKQLVQ